MPFWSRVAAPTSCRSPAGFPSPGLGNSEIRIWDRDRCFFRSLWPIDAMIRSWSAEWRGKGVFVGSLAHWLRSPQSHATVWGEIEWHWCNGHFDGDCLGNVSTGDELLLRLIYRPMRPDEPTVLYRVGDVAWRIDHNQPHRGEYSTHIQLDGSEHFEVVSADDAASPRRGEASVSALEVTLRKSAGLLGVDTRGMIWLDPPEEAER